MKINATSVMLGLGLAAGLAGAANAGGSYSDIGIKTSRDAAVAVPVPAPVPMPVSAANWYVRGGISTGVLATGGDAYAVGALSFPTKSANDMPNYLGLDVAAGYYVMPWLRVEMELDYRTKQRVAAAAGAQGRTTITQSTQTVTGNNGVITQTMTQQLTTTRTWSDTTTEEAHAGNYAAMFNAYFDFKNSSPFTPYIGAGVGVTMNTLYRGGTDAHACTHETVVGAADAVWNIPAVNTASNTCTVSDSAASSTKNATAYGLAASLMAGVAYEVSSGVFVDAGYRMMYLNGKVAAVRDSALGASMLNLEDRIDHEVRTGVRFNFD